MTSLHLLGSSPEPWSLKPQSDTLLRTSLHLEIWTPESSTLHPHHTATWTIAMLLCHNSVLEEGGDPGMHQKAQVFLISFAGVVNKSWKYTKHVGEQQLKAIPSHWAGIRPKGAQVRICNYETCILFYTYTYMLHKMHMCTQSVQHATWVTVPPCQIYISVGDLGCTDYRSAVLV